MRRLPTCTLCLFFYKQERFVEESVKAALAQDYPNLEVILSDDCSGDGTFEAMKKAVSDYRGPHRVIVRQTEGNRGLSGHVNEVAAMATGEWVVLAAGDDVSLPERVRVLMEYAGGHEEVRGMGSRYVLVGEDGKEIGSRGVIYWTERNEEMDGVGLRESLRALRRDNMGVILGCSAAWHGDVFRKFPKLPKGLIHEDVVLTYRAKLLGNTKHLKESLVKYRFHDGSVSRQLEAMEKDAEQEEKRIQLEYRRLAFAYLATAKDLLFWARKTGEVELPKLARMLMRHALYFRRYANWWGLSFGERLGVVFYFFRTNPKGCRRVKFFSRKKRG